MQLFAVGYNQHEVHFEIGANERGIAMGPFLGPGVEQPRIEARAVRKIVDTNASVKFLC